MNKTNEMRDFEQYLADLELREAFTRLIEAKVK